MRKNLPVTNNEIHLRDDQMIVSKTDLKGQITYVNQDFLEISGFTERELIGEPHNLVRHPDMPPVAFQDLWDTIKAGRPWTGIVKNRCKNGDHYWVDATATPLYENDKIVGYMSLRRKPTKAQVEAASALYQEINAGKVNLARKEGLLAKLGVANKLAVLVGGGVGLIFLLLVLLMAFQGENAFGFVAVGGVLAILISSVLAKMIADNVVVQPLAGINRVVDAITHGDFAQKIGIPLTRPDEIGDSVRAVVSMQTRLGFEVAETKRIAAETSRLKIGLDNVATNVRIADNDGNLLYVNNALKATMVRDVEAFRKHDPNFDPERLIGYNVGGFYADPAAAVQRLRNLTATVQSQMELGGRHYRVTTTPVITESGSRLGSVGEWVDITDQLKAQSLLKEVIQKAAEGDFTIRLSLNSQETFFSEVEGLINQLLANGENALNELSVVLSAIADGDLNRTITSDYHGVFGRLKNDTNTTVGRLREVISQIKESTDAINTAAHEIASGNQDLSARTEEQASSLEETASSMEELTSTVKHNAENANAANTLAGSAQQVAERGGAVVNQVVETMSAIHQSSSKISDIIGVIDGIAFQTNILALNAAVEAARAGEQGRGFAVVATEVRNLAQRSAGAAKEIKSLISDSVEKVEIGTKLVDQAGQTMEEVVGSIKRVAKIMADIAEASREQSAGIEQVGLAVSQMDEVTQQNAALVEEAAAAAESLEDQARNLSNSVSIFRMSASGAGVAKALASTPSVPEVARERSEPPREVRKQVPAVQASLDDEWAEF